MALNKGPLQKMTCVVSVFSILYIVRQQNTVELCVYVFVAVCVCVYSISKRELYTDLAI